jgi:hypothetical protein
MALQPHTNYVDGQIINLPGPDGSFIGYMYDAETRTFWAHETQVMASLNHGHTHVGTDPVPAVTTDTNGLMSKNDKVKLDAIVGTRLGVLGYQGAGFPDDGGWLQGDIILASGSESISIERVGNIVRFVVDVPTPLSCPCEECAEIYWVRDFADSGQNGYAIRGPQCGGLLPDVHTYGEFKVYMPPSNTIFTNPDSELPALMNTSPAFIFKRYDDGVAGGAGSNQAEMEMVLDRISGSYVTKTGWSMTPGALGVAECVWHMGLDSSNNKITFKLMPEMEPGLIGALMYKGWTLTQRPARVTALHSTNSSTNKYVAEWWDVDTNTAPERPTTFDVTNAVNYEADGTIVPDVVAGATLQLGRIINVFSLEASAGIWRHYIHEIAQINPSTLWYTMGEIEFGNVFEARTEDDTINGAENVDDFRNLERSQWGMAGIYDDLVVAGVNLNQENTAYIDTTLPGLVVGATGTDQHIARPVMVWHRNSARDAYLEMHLARPDDIDSNPDEDFVYPPIDILLRAPVDSFENQYGYVKVVEEGAAQTGTVVVAGLQIHDIAPSGYLRVINTDNGNHNSIIKYQSKSAFYALTGSDASISDRWDTAFISTDISCGGSTSCIAAGDVVEVLHEEYTAPAVRLLFKHGDSGSGSAGSGSGSTAIITMQAYVGTLGMSVPYVDDVSGIEDNFIRGFESGYTVSGIYTQNGTIQNPTGSVVSVPSDFVVYDGTVIAEQEIFNVLKILLRDQQVYIWWNDMAVTPSSALSQNLPTPVAINTSYFPITDEVTYGKFAMRLWPGAGIRRFITRTNFEQFSQFTLGVNNN